MRVIEILLTYVQRGADVLRLDAVTYIWRELGTSCAHLRETHALVQLFRAILDAVAPHVALITETNVPHADNIGYFGDGTDEAQLVYNFALPPLVLHTFHSGSCDTLARWARTLVPISDTANYFNFLSSHDGVGLLGARGILTDDEVTALVDRTVAHGGFVSYRSNGDGTQSPYELNITWYSALNKEGNGESQALQVARFLAARAIAARDAWRARHLPADALRRQERHRCGPQGRRETQHQPPHLRRGVTDAAAGRPRRAGCRRWHVACGAWSGGASRSRRSIPTRHRSCSTPGRRCSRCCASGRVCSACSR